MNSWGSHTETLLVHECTTFFMRELLPRYLGDHLWVWPRRDGVEIMTEAQRQQRASCLDLSPCFFGWPRSRERCYSVFASACGLLRLLHCCLLFNAKRWANWACCSLPKVGVLRKRASLPETHVDGIRELFRFPALHVHDLLLANPESWLIWACAFYGVGSRKGPLSTCCCNI